MSWRLLQSKRLAMAGFTIVELMIATLVFSTILIIVTSGVLQFTNNYYKGINSSTTQNIARSVADSISQAVQFSASTPQVTITDPLNGYICAGTKEYVYHLGKEVNDTTSVHGLLQYNIAAGNCPASPGGGGQEILQPGMRLARFSATQLGSQPLWKVDIKIVFGDDDLLCAPVAKIGSCDADTMLDFTDPATLSDLACASNSSSRFCGTSALTTVVQARFGT